MKPRFCRRAFLLLLVASVCWAQAPTGTIAGLVTDESGAAVPNAKVSIVNKDTGLTRETVTRLEGVYSAPSLPAGTYEVKAEAPGFRIVARTATVETGSTTAVDFSLPIGTTRDVVTVADASSQIVYDSSTVDGVVNRRQIESLPLNGRSFLQLAMLEPGVTSANTSGGQYNRQFDVAILGASADSTRITVDGGAVLDFVTGGTALNFSQEMVEEFQISTVNLDLSTGVTGAGAVNIVTRSGGNSFHGNGFYFFRDHNMAAYPALQRDPVNPDPFFARRQTGFNLGGPVRKDRAFFFANLEHNNQDQVFTIQPRVPEFARFGQIAPSPYDFVQTNARFDYRFSQSHTLFLRHAYDNNDTFAPLGAPNFPSNWRNNRNWAHQGLLGLTSTLSPNLVGDLRFNFTHWTNTSLHPSAEDCPGQCIGRGFSQINVLGAGFQIGNTTDAPQGRINRRFHTTENLTWQRGSHRMQFGVEWEYDQGTGYWGFLEPAAMVLYPPEFVRLYNSDPRVPAPARIPLPSSFNTIQDILALPLAGFQTGIGDPSQPPPFQIQKADHGHTLRLYWQDTWRVRPRFTLKYGLAYVYQSNLLNHDLSKPQFLAPILGAGGLDPTAHDTNNFAPSLGFAWTATDDGKTVIRGGAGLFYETKLLWHRLRERGIIGPRGNGRVPLSGDLVPNPIPGIPTVPQGTLLNFTTGPTQFTGAHLVAILPAVRASLQQAVGNPSNTDLSVRTIDVFKQGAEIIPGNFPLPYAEHFNFGVQRELRSDLALNADFVFRQFLHQEMGAVDYNRWDSVRGPVMPRCVGLQALDPRALCSTGAITVRTPAGRSHYTGLLVKLDKRFSNRYQLLASYALSSNVGFNGIVNKENWFESFGPTGSDRRHLLNVSGVIELPKGFQVSFITSAGGKAPFRVNVEGLDFTGSGVNAGVLPGSKVNQFNRGLDKSDLGRLVTDFNQNFAGRRTSRNQLIPTVTLPSNFEFGDTFFSQDLRISKTFTFGDRYRLTVLGEMFNLLNVANLTDYNNNLRETAAFGQPTRRFNQVFGSGGPRALQLGGRISF